MRPVTITGVTGNSVAIPLDAYISAGQALASFQTAGAPALQTTLDDVFNTDAANINWQNMDAPASGPYIIPQGTRAIRGTGMVAADVLTVSQQGII